MRRAILNPESLVYKAMLRFIVPTEDRTGYCCPICKLKLSTESLMVSHLALRPHWTAKTQLRVLHLQRLRQLKCKLCHKQFDSEGNFWRHQVRDHFYDVTARLVLEKCPDQIEKFECPDENCPFQHEKLPVVVDHLGVDHLKVKELYKRFLVNSQTVTCHICKSVTSSVEELKLHLTANHFSSILMNGNHFYGSDSSYHCTLCGHQEDDRSAMVAHVGSAHNMTEELYRRHLKGVDIKCELCTAWSSCRKGQFMNHITRQHCREILMNRQWVKDLYGNAVYRCDVCSEYFPQQSLYLDHVGQEGRCNQALVLYFSIVDRHLHGLLNPPQLSAEQAQARLENSLLNQDMTSGVTFFKSFLSEMSGDLNNSLDPFSCDINFNYNINTNNVSIILQDPVHPVNLKPRCGAQKGPFQCIFCDILGEEYVEMDLTLFQVHLAEHHFSVQLESYFPVSSSRDGSYRYNCHLCRSQVLFSDFPSLTWHLASQHEIIIGLYEATKPPQLLCDNSTKSPPPDRALLSSIFPWFPRGFPTITSLSTNKTGNKHQHDVYKSSSPTQCLECLEEFSSVSLLVDHMSLMEHVSPSWVAQTNDKGLVGR